MFNKKKSREQLLIARNWPGFIFFPFVKQHFTETDSPQCALQTLQSSAASFGGVEKVTSPS